MLQFVLGPSKSGKTTYIDNEIMKLSEEKQRIFLIVPEQYTFETEKRLYRKLSGKRLNQVTVTSFTRIAQTAFKLYGGGAGTYADEEEGILEESGETQQDLHQPNGEFGGFQNNGDAPANGFPAQNPSVGSSSASNFVPVVLLGVSVMIPAEGVIFALKFKR